MQAIELDVPAAGLRGFSSITVDVPRHGVVDPSSKTTLGVNDFEGDDLRHSCFVRPASGGPARRYELGTALAGGEILVFYPALVP